MAGKSKTPKVWINPKSPLLGGNHRASEEAQDIYKERFLELADVLEKPGMKAKKKTNRQK
jgi:hypothetical protein